MQQAHNIEAIAHCGVDYLGFIFVQGTPRYVTPELRAALPKDLPGQVKSVAVFRDATHQEVEDIVRCYRFAALQLHGQEDPSYLAECRRRLPGCTIIKAVTLGEHSSSVTELPSGADLFVFDSTNPGSGQEFDWERIRLYRGETPFLLAGGIGPDNICRVQEVLKQYPLCIGVDLNSKVESSPGVKDENAVRAVVEGIRV
jgi:phosphoribosylanthranilate isomerase